MNPFKEMYEKANGRHFDEALYGYAASKMRNADGTKGAHWKAGEAVSAAKQRGATMDGYNDWDLAYAMNMAYSDYKGAVPDGVDSYAKIALAFLEDADAPEGKAYLYWLAMQC